MRIAYSLLAACLLIAACSDGGGTTTEPPPPPPPPPPFQLEITGGGTFTGTRHTDAAGQVLVTCSFQITAKASGGTAGESATWDGGRVDFVRSDGATFVQLLGTRDHLVGWFGSDRVVTGSTATANRAWNWTGPFTATHILYYKTAAGELRSSTVVLDCR